MHSLGKKGYAINESEIQDDFQKHVYMLEKHRCEKKQRSRESNRGNSNRNKKDMVNNP